MATPLVRRYAEGLSLDYTAGADISAGDIVARGRLFGISEFPIANGDTGATSRVGLYQIAKATGGGSGFGDGVPLFVNTDTRVASKTPGENIVYFGVTVGVSTDTDTVLYGLFLAGTIPQIPVIAQATTFADLAAATTAYNALLTALKNAGLMANA